MIDHSENQYALEKNDNLVSVFDVPTGEACECRCTKCNEPVAAKNKGKTRDTELKPKQRAAHFYHIVSKNCQGETLVHILAKEIIKESKRLVFEIHEYDFYGDIVKTRYQEVNFDTVTLEKRLDFGKSYIIPDVTATVKSKRLFIEIVYQNNISDSKRNLIRENKLSFLAIHFNINEINWNEFEQKSQLKEKIRWFLYEKKPKHHKWIYNSKMEQNQYLVDSPPSKIIKPEPQIKSSNSEKTSKNKNEEIDYEPSLGIKLLLDKEGTERKLQAIGLVLDYGELWFVESILKWEEKYYYFLDDNKFETEGAELKVKEYKKYELLNLQSINMDEWHSEYDRIKRKKFFK